MKSVNSGKVVVSGLGCLTPFGLGVEQVWGSLCNAHSAIKPISRFDAAAYRTKIAAEVDDSGDALSSQLGLSVSHLSRNARFAVAAAHDLLIDSGLTEHSLFRRKLGICLGSGLGGIYFSEESMASLLETGPRGVSPMTVPFVDPNSIVSQIAIKWGIR